YVIAGILWIALSDKLLLALQNTLDLQLVFFISSVKGIGYVLITGLLLYKLISIHTQRLAESERQYRSYFDYNITPMWIINRRTLLFHAVNNAAITNYGYSREEFLTMSVLDIQVPEDINNLIINFRDLKIGINEAASRRHIKKNGTIITVDITAHVITGKNTENIMVIAKEVVD
ncbi:MAG: PAS domain S-box protein, partial [Sphingobacteriaceae bacterium]